MVKTVFVTVGTTVFEALVEGVLTNQALDWMVSNGFERLVIQYGKGTKPELSGCNHSLAIDVYDFKPNLQEDMRRADLILSHAGAGTIMEALRMQKRLVVVINTCLMHNHQTELANVLGEQKLLLVVDKPELLREKDTWKTFEDFQRIPFESGDEYEFPALLDKFFHFEPTKTS